MAVSRAFRIEPLHVTVVEPVQEKPDPDVCVTDTNVAFAGV
jgi:hypothetical protein